MFLKYYEAGFVPIPIAPNSKRPVHEAEGFNNWAHEGIPRAKVEEFEEKFPPEKGFGIGLVCGKASNICVIDIDTDDYELLNSCPPSPVRRRGKTGEARFFRYNPELTNRAFTKKDDQGIKVAGCDILVEKKYIIVPPSIHPVTKRPFVWLGEQDLFDGAEDLPNANIEDIDAIGTAFGYDDVSGFSATVDLEGTYESPDGNRSAHGSYNRLKAVCAGLIAEELPLETGIAKLLNYDNNHHKPFGYFSDRRRHSDFGADPYSNTARFYACLMKTINENRMRKGLRPHSPKSPKEIEIDIRVFQPKLEQASNFIRYPEPRGLMKEFVNYCELMGKGRQDALGLGGSLIMMSGLAANRYRSTVRGLPVTPNLFVLNLGYSSFGKDVSQSLLQDLFVDTGMIGSANYRSGTAIVQNLPEQQERLDIIDECSWLLNAMSSGDSYQAEMTEILSLLFSRASKCFNGIASAKEGARYGAAWNPHVSILASTTPVGFKESVNAAMASKGLMPRFITLFQKEIGEYKGETDVQAAKALVKVMADGIAFHMAREKKHFAPKVNYASAFQRERGEDMKMGLHYDPMEIVMVKGTHKKWIEYEKHNHYKSAKHPDDFESPFYGRFAELAAKVALLDALSLGRSEILIDSLDWAIELIEIQWKNAQPLYEMTKAENRLEKNHLRVYKLIEEHGVIQKRDLTRKTQWVNKKQRDEIIANLVDSDRIKESMIKDPQTGKKKLYLGTTDVMADLEGQVNLA